MTRGTHTFTRPSLVFCDVDGVLAEFAHPFSKLLNAEFGIPVRHTREVSDWWKGDGVTGDMIKWGFKAIEQIEDFWTNAPALATPDQFKRIAAAAAQLPILFVTARAASAGDTVFHQTTDWLEAHGIPEPLVVVSKAGGAGGRTDKTRLIEHFNPGLIIEDAPHTAVEFADHGIPVALMDWPYTATEETLRRRHLITLCNLDKALDMAGA